MTGDDGTFALSVPADAVAADSARPLAVTAQSLGFRSATLEINPGATDTASVEFLLEHQALALSELVVTGAAQPQTTWSVLEEVEGAREVWVPVTRARAESQAAFALLTVPELAILEIELGKVKGAVAVRMR